MPLLVGLLIVSVSERGNTAIGRLRQAGLVAALMDPLSLFADRSPGERGAGPLLSTKPEQRVLSTVRDRDPGMLPAADDPVFASALPGAGAPPFGGPVGDDPLIGPATFSGPFYPFAAPPGEIIPGRALIGPPPSGPILSAVPEPGTWAVMILGFFAVGAAARRRARQRVPHVA